MLGGVRLPVRRDDSVANYLSASVSASANVSVGPVSISAGASVGASVGGGLSVGGGVAVFGGAGFGGSKPQALHTEHATGSANWVKPYGASTDIVFYMMRAG